MLSPSYQPMDAYTYGVFVEVAYQMYQETSSQKPPDNLKPSVPPSMFPADYQLVLYLTAVDHFMLESERKPFGFVAQSKQDPSLFVAAIRGTERTLEWLIDAEFVPTPFTPVANAGKVDDGFFGIYKTLTGLLPSGEQVPSVLTFIKEKVSSGTLVVAGHSLGGALANMLALDVAVNAPVASLMLYTLAAPRTGDQDFFNCFTANVPVSYRVFNDPDIVPKLPPRYEQVNTGEAIDSKSLPELKHSLACYHELTTYLYTLNQKSIFPVGSCQTTG